MVKNGGDVDYNVISPNEILKYTYDYLIIAAEAFDVIFAQCIEVGVSESKIIGVTPYGSGKFQEIYTEANSRTDKIFNLDYTKDFFKRNLPQMDVFGHSLSNEIFLDDTYQIRCKSENSELQRVLALYALSKEIKINNVAGSVAELGVYKGDFAKIINGLFPESELYLFDTFEGFDSVDLEFDKSQDYSTASLSFKDTNIELVLSKMPHKDKCKVVKGYFPESAMDIDDTFSFVSIDADLFLPIYDGLKFFYDKLSKNGYLMIHDFNNVYFSGAREAVMKFCHEKRIGYVPIIDFNGSVVITK